MKRILKSTLLLSLFWGLSLFTSCTKGDNDTGGGAGKYTNGTFILNEGNLNTHTDNPMQFIGTHEMLIEGVYELENGGMLPALSQDLFIANNNIAIIGQSGVLMVSDANTLKFKKKYTTKLGLTASDAPTNVAMLGNDVYIRSEKGITRFNLADEDSRLISESEGALPKRMAVVGNKIYALTDTHVLVISQASDAVIAEIEIATDIKGVSIIPSADGNLWLAGGSASRNAIMKLNSSTNTIEYHNVDYPLSSSSVAPNIAASGDKIYFASQELWSSPTHIGVHDYAKNETKLVIQSFDSYLDGRYTSGVVYNGIAINPANSLLYVNVIKGWSDYRTNDLLLLNMSGETPTLEKSYQDKSSFPAGVYFTESF